MVFLQERNITGASQADVFADARPKGKRQLSSSGGNSSPGWFVKPDFVNLLNEKFDEDALAELLIADVYGEDGCEQFGDQAEEIEVEQ